MTQQHLDRLSALDASFLHQEGPASHMHVGAVTVFDGPAPDLDELLDHVRGRLHLVPRYRQRLITPPLDTGRPLWIDDPTFDVEYHVRHATLSAPGGKDGLTTLAAAIMSRQLDRAKPLWELWLVDGLKSGGFALVSKTHHALIDGVAGIDLATVMLDLTPVPQEPAHPDEPWRPQRAPTSAELLAGGALGAAKVAVGAATGLLGAFLRPQSALVGARDAIEGLGEVVRAGMDPAPPTPLNVEIGPDRRFVPIHNRLDDFKTIKNAFGGTVNDVVLTVVTAGLRTWLRERRVSTEDLELRALVPVSVRTSRDRGTLGNRISAMRGPLPVSIDDPLDRLRAVKSAMDGLKESKQAIGAEVLANVQNFAPPTVLAQASRLNFSTRLFNLLVTNVPGPQFPLYLRGRELTDVFPVAFLPKDHALAIAIMSYNGKMDFGLLADRDALPDVDAIADGIRAARDELLELACAQREPRTIRASNGAAPDPAPIGAPSA